MNETLAYLDVARTALALAIQLKRIARGTGRGGDLQGIENAATNLEQLLTVGGATSDHLFARPEGLDVTIQASERLFPVEGEGGDALKTLADKLKGIATVVRKPLTNDLQLKAEELSRLFRDIHDRAEEIASEGRKSSSRRGSARARGEI